MEQISIEGKPLVISHSSVFEKKYVYRLTIDDLTKDEAHKLKVQLPEQNKNYPKLVLDLKVLQEKSDRYIRDLKHSIDIMRQEITIKDTLIEQIKTMVESPTLTHTDALDKIRDIQKIISDKLGRN